MPTPGDKAAPRPNAVPADAPRAIFRPARRTVILVVGSGRQVRLVLLGEVAEWLKAPVLKTGYAQAYVGSNPSLSVEDLRGGFARCGA